MKTKTMKITKHAYRRFGERTDFSPGQRNHDAKQAWKRGYGISQFGEPLYSYLFEKQREGDRTSVKAWWENIYVFDNRHKRLVTVYPVPERFLPIKQYLSFKPIPCVIELGGSRFVSEDGETPTVFKSKQSANNYIKNNHDLDFEDVEVIPIGDE